MGTRLSYRTDVGKKRPHNEDAVKIYENKFCTVMVVADGMGGHEAGDIASQMVLEGVESQFNESTSFEQTEQLRQWMKKMLRQINDNILKYIDEHDITHGMGTTVIIAVITPDFIGFGHAGDSRAYLIRNGKLRQITRDHTFVRKLVEEGKLSEQQAKKHPHRNIIMNALGVNQDLKFDYLLLERYEVDALMLCTDGLTSMIEDEKIIEILGEQQATEIKVEHLIQAANENGGSDNVSVALFEWIEGSWTI
ncbi:MAG: Stp1/IreP family PP2C-type Ser/Thr phosphatase [Turicibacter sp.]